MKKIITFKHLALTALSLLFLLPGCSDFDEINMNPNSAEEGQIKPMWMLNRSIGGAQMNPHIAERIFVIYWMGAARYQAGGALNTGSYGADYDNDYFNAYLSQWCKDAKQTVHLATKQLADDNFESQHDKEMAKNVREVARIWYVYLLSEFTDNFGPAPLDGFTGVRPTYSSVKEVYAYMLKELSEATKAIDLKIVANEEDKKSDMVYGFDFAKWVKYGHSLQMRLAMRMSGMDEAAAKSYFAEAAQGPFISEEADIFQVQEMDGWNEFAGVLSRSWNALSVSQTMINLTNGLGGISSSEALKNNPDAVAKVKPQGYIGVHYANHYPEYADDPSNGFFMDGVPYSMDPRFFSIYALPGDDKHPFVNAKEKSDDITLKVKKGNETPTLVTLDIKYTVNSYSVGAWGDRAALNDIRGNYPYAIPAISSDYRNSTGKRIFFGPWESYFLLAEAAVKGWSIGISGKEAYEAGVRSSFLHHGLGDMADRYLASESYNKVGTSVAWDHTTEPPKSITVDIIDGYSKKAEKYNYIYPEASKTLYGKALNDHLSKIMTQKFIAQCPFGALETWSDHRRTGLPFFERPAADAPIASMPQITKENYNRAQKSNDFPQRIRYPQSFENNNPEGYAKAVELIGGKNDIFAPFDWAKK